MSFEEKKEEILVVPSGKLHVSGQFIIMQSKDIADTDIELLKEYGKVIRFDAKVYVNVPIQSLTFDYFIMDLRSKEDRMYYSQIDKEYLETCNVVTICHSFEKEEGYHDEIGVDNIISKFPEKQAFKADFDRLLLLKKISKPRPIYSFFKSCLRVVKGDWK